MGTGEGILKRMEEHIGEDYVLGATVALTYKNWRGPWDCSLIVSKMVYEESGIVYGCVGSDPDTADPYTGAWGDDARNRGMMISIEQAKATPGATLLRLGQRIGHAVVSDGKGGTVEAMGSAWGVTRGQVDGRRWDMGVLVPGISYQIGYGEITLPVKIYRMVTPYMKGPDVREIQKALLRAGMKIVIDDVYGPETANAVIQYQRKEGLVVDGEVGSQTMRSLGLFLI